MAKTARAVPKRPTSGPSFPALVKHYQEEIEKGLQAADHMERHRALQKTLSPYAVAHLLRFFAKTPLESIDTAATTGYAMRRLEAAEDRDVVDDELRDLSRLLKFAVEHGWLERHPAIYFVPRPRPATTDHGMRPPRWFRQAAEGGSHPLEPAPVKPGRRRTDAEDIAAIRAQYPRADTESRGWWARCMKRFRKHPGSLKNIERQLKRLDIPPSRGSSSK